MTSLDRPADTFGSSDNELIARAKQGDASAFAVLYERFADSVYRHILYRTGNRADSEDLTQQTLIRAWQAIGRYEIRQVPFLAWLIAIAQNVVISHVRRRHEHAPLEPDPLVVDTDPEPDEQVERNFTRETVRQAVARLPADQQQVVVMRYLDGLDYAVVARALGKTENNVRVIAFRALRRLQTYLGDEA